ncbi:phage tail tape measure protein [Pseudomonas sp. NPDC087358]|uniref:phage tail tape measure protein n=1 Tax=Pseudomonas sp. NPDC087358 TaxID=3364439 RepID=UPI00384E3845
MAADSLGQLTVDLIANTGGFEAGMDRAQRSLKSATKEAAYQATQLDRLVGQIDPVVGAYGRLDKMEEQLRAHRKAGRLDSSDFDDYLKKLNDQRSALVQTDSLVQKNAMSAKAYSAALRNVPAQFTDIAVSLQAGQAPLTVFLQQGGQLKDMFGGIGPAAKALGGYVLGLVNPFTVSAAAVVALALAYKQGSDETTAYLKSLALTGNTAGTTSGQLSAMAQQVAQSSGTVGKASEVLAQLAGSTKIPSAAFEMLAESAVKFESATGQAASETVANFEKIAKDPVKASLALNESLNYLTASTYEQIKALQDQGDAAGAASLAESEYAKALSTRSDAIKTNLGSIERGWNAVKSAAKGAWDAVLDIGREKTYEEKMADLQAQLANAQRLGSGSRGGGGRGVVQVQADINDLTFEEADRTRRAKAKAEAQQAQQQSVTDAVYLDHLHDEFDTNATKRAEKLAEYKSVVTRKQLEADRSGDQSLAISQEQQAKDIADINAKWADQKTKAVKAYVEDAGTKELDQAKQQYAVLQQQSEQLDEQTGKLKALGPAQQELIKWEQELADIKDKKTLTAAQKALLATADQITAQKTVNAALEKDTQARTESAEQQKQLAEFTQAQADALSRFQQGLDNQVTGIGLGAEGRKRLQDDLALQNDYANQVERLRRDKVAGKITQDTYDKQKAILQDTLDKELQAYKDNYGKIDAARAQWQNGMTAALQDYSYEAADIAGQTYGLVTDGLHGVEDAFVELASSGKFSFKSLADSVIADLARIGAKALVIMPLLSFLGLSGDSSGGAGASGALSGLGGGGGLSSLLNNVSSVVSVAGSKLGQAITSGWTGGDGIIGGIQGAFTNGADYIGSVITGAFSTGSATAAQVAGNFAASTTPATVDLISNTVSVGGQTVGTASGMTASAATSSLASLSTVLSYVGAVYSVIQSFQQYGIKGGATTAGFAAAGAAIGTWVFPVVGTALGAAIGAVVGSIASSKLFSSGEKYPDTSTSGQVEYSNGALTNLGTVQGWQTKAPKFGDAADAQIATTLGKFTSTLGMLYDTLGNGADVYAYNTLQVRKTSGKYSTTFGATLDNGTGIGLDDRQQFNAADAAAALTENYDNIMGTFLAKAIVSSVSLPDYFKAQFTDFANSWDTTADEVIKAIEGVFTRFNGVNDALSLINVNNLKLDNTGLMASDSILNMIGAMSDLDTTTATAKEKVDALNTAVSTYYKAFFSADEQFADLTKSLKGAFAGFGLELPDTRSAYRAMVEDIDVTTTAGQAMFATLVGLATSADSYYSTLGQKAADAQQAAADAAQKITDGLMQGANDAFNALQRSITAQKASLNDLLTAANTNVSDLTGVSNDLSSALKTLHGNSDTATTMLRAQAQATLQSALATARAGGSLANVTGLSDALDAVSSNNTDMYASLEDFNRDQGRAAALIDELNTLNGKQLTNAEKTVKALQDQLDRLDDQLEFAQAQLDALNGVDNSVMTVTEAVNAMNAAVVAALGNIKSATPGNTSTLIDSVYQDVLGHNADTAGKNYWQNQVSSGSLGVDQLAEAIKNAAAQDAIKSAYNSVLHQEADAAGAKYWADQVSSGALTVAQLAEAIKNAAKANGSIQAFAKGTNSWDGMPALVGEFGPEIVSQDSLGSRTIYPAQKSRALLNPGDSDGQDREDTQNFRDKVVKKMNEIARNTGWLDAWNNDGMPAVRA